MTKSILITGAGSGFGKGAALALAKKGHNVIAGVQVSPQKSELLAAAKTAGVDIETIILDVTSEEDRTAAFGHEIDVLVNNAGIMEAGPIAEIPMSHVRRNFETNVFGTLAMVQGFAPQMVKRGSGKIVTLSSIAGLVTMPFGAVYSAPKQALEAIMEGLTIELHGTGVQACTVNPGMYDTGFNDRGVETMGTWFNPETTLSPAELLAPLEGILNDQLDPQEQIDDLVRVIEEDRPKFRNACPAAVEPWVKAIEAKSWEANADEPVWVDMPTD
jgi:NAD(P)-dependent dehydrogenase (short-subunit alcohol dehydrogenase family)